MSLMKIAEVNDLSYEAFISVFGNVVEHCGLCAAAVWQNGPFTDIHHLHGTISQFLDELPVSGKEGVLRLHPDLAGRLAQEGGLTSESTKEQRSAGLDSMSDTERQTMSERNAKYRKKFGFPFVICARQNKKEAILTGLATRFENDRLTEAETGVNEVKKICLLRLLDIVDPTSKL